MHSIAAAASRTHCPRTAYPASLRGAGLAGLQRNCWNLQSLGAGTGSGADAITGLPHTGIRGFSRSLDCSKIYR